MTYKEIEAKLKELKELKIMQEELNDQITELEDAIKAEMTAQNTDTLRAGAFKATWKPYTSSRFDSSAFKKAHADLYDSFCRPVTGTRFTLNQVRAA